MELLQQFTDNFTSTVQNIDQETLTNHYNDLSTQFYNNYQTFDFNQTTISFLAWANQHLNSLCLYNTEDAILNENI